MRNQRTTLKLVAAGLVSLPLGGAVVGSSGCVAVAAGAAAGIGTYVYVHGELTDVENATMDRAWSGTQDAIKELGFAVAEQAKDSLKARLKAKEADGTPITINLETQGEKAVKFSIRIGVFGDEATSRLIMDKIKARL